MCVYSNTKLAEELRQDIFYDYFFMNMDSVLIWSGVNKTGYF